MNHADIYHKSITMRAILTFTLPTILMILVQSSYSMIDGVFVANLVGETALSSLTLISPYLNLFIAISAMFASGGSAVVMKKMGEARAAEAREDFSMLLAANVAVGLALTVITVTLAGPLAAVFDASEAVTAFCQEYLWAYGWFLIPQLLFSNLQIYTIASGQSRRAMSSAIFGGVANIAFDYLLIDVLALGMTGAAIATGLGMLIPCLIMGLPLFKQESLLHFTRPRFRPQVLAKTITNGFSEFSSNLVSGVVMLLFNAQMLGIAGESGIAASTITFYVFGVMSAVYMGYMFGISPLLSYFYGAAEQEKLRRLRAISLTFIACVAIVTTALAVIGSPMLAAIFVKRGTPAFAMAVSGNRLFSLALLLVGFNTFASMLFTALSNGKVSAIIAFSRTFVFLVAAILLLPLLWGINGLWLAVPVSEAAAAFLSAYYIKKHQPQYGY